MWKLSGWMVLWLFLLTGCTTIPSLQERMQTLSTLSSQHDLSSETIETRHFRLYSINDLSECNNKDMRIYIEGDGFAWVTRTRISDDPTPINPLTAKLMVQDTSKCKVYLARPCQYVGVDRCDSDYWSEKRFADKVVQSYNEAFDRLKKKYGNSTFTLFGYSGGGAIALLSAADRNDVRRLVTIAGNLDTDAWVEYHRLSPLVGSLNPSQMGSKLESIPQIHFIGAEDRIIPEAMFKSYRKQLPDPRNVKSVLCEECTHNKGWSEKWENYLNMIEER
jgi:hypothetical protein